MNEILIFLGTVRDGGWWFLAGILAIASALIVLDRPAKAPSIEHTEELPVRKAA